MGVTHNQIFIITIDCMPKRKVVLIYTNTKNDGNSCLMVIIMLIMNNLYPITFLSLLMNKKAKVD